ncbi:MAG: hypothetical protein WBB28_21600 [Crinalium sp.]
MFIHQYLSHLFRTYHFLGLFEYPRMLTSNIRFQYNQVKKLYNFSKISAIA